MKVVNVCCTFDTYKYVSLSPTNLTILPIQQSQITKIDITLPIPQILQSGTILCTGQRMYQLFQGSMPLSHSMYRYVWVNVLRSVVGHTRHTHLAHGQGLPNFRDALADDPWGMYVVKGFLKRSGFSVKICVRRVNLCYEFQ